MGIEFFIEEKCRVSYLKPLQIKMNSYRYLICSLDSSQVISELLEMCKVHQKAGLPACVTKYYCECLASKLKILQARWPPVSINVNP